MKKGIISILLFSLLSFPYVFIAMFLDVSQGSMLGYGIMAVMSLILGYTARYFGLVPVLVIGNLVSLVISYYLNTTMAGHEKWGWYFKPLTSQQLLIVVSILNLIPQILGLTIHRNQKDKPKKARI
ncbi:hypothetical protein [Neobacillus niacini]|uniref:hypothetical protein n=1 Tax=Neobacillus niacini TaxID=86668 RepID=UPI0021CB26B2|nr:hypothetical protein [Neobacillus niacini]MCM3765134.1 hypothetical protein [Neobacillus niacini]